MDKLIVKFKEDNIDFTETNTQITTCGGEVVNENTFYTPKEMRVFDGKSVVDGVGSIDLRSYKIHKEIKYISENESSEDTILIHYQKKTQFYINQAIVKKNGEININSKTPQYLKNIITEIGKLAFQERTQISS